MNFEPAYDRLPLSEFPKRIGSFVLDFCACAFIGKLIESLLGINEQSGWGIVMFALVWLGDRVLLGGNNQGQSIGRWLLNLKTVDMYYGKTAGMAELFKRELIVFPFLAVLLVAIKSPTSIAIFAVLPLAIDGAFAVADSRKVQTLHDKLGKTIVILTRRGFQLDRKLAQIFTLISRLPIPSIPKPDFTRRNEEDYFTLRPPKTANRRPRKRK
jgi:uncharacterized RDD family membrane protein YckC